MSWRPLDLYGDGDLGWFKVPGASIPAGGLGLFGGGQVSSGASAAVESYVFNTDVVANTTSLSSARAALASASNQTVGLFSNGGGGSATIEKYAFSSMTTSLGSALGNSRVYMGGTGNLTEALFAGGSPLQSRTDRYTYSNDAVVYIADLQFSGASPRYGVAPFSSTTIAYFIGGTQNGSNEFGVSNKYTYSSATMAVLGSPGGSRFAAGLASPTHGYWSTFYNVGVLTGIGRLQFSNESGGYPGGTFLGVGRIAGGGASNPTYGVWSGGTTDGNNPTNAGAATTYTDKLNLSPYTIAPGATLSVARTALKAVSTSPGSL